MLKSVYSRPLLLTFALLALGGCTAETNPFKDMQMPSWMSNGKQQAPANKLVSVTADCPRVSALPELARVTQFADEHSSSPETILTETQITKLDSSCINSENAINLDIIVNFTSKMGRAGLAQGSTESSYTHAYFVAVVNPDGSILAKDVFGLSPVFASGQKEVFSSERLQQTIPLSKTIPADRYQIMIGFQLSEAELAYNRALKPKEVAPMAAATAPVVAARPQASASPSSGLSIQPLVRNRKKPNQ